MPTYNIIRQVGNPGFACVVRAELVTMYFVSYNVPNTVAIEHYCKLSLKNVSTIAWTGIVSREERCCLDLLTINGTKYSTFQEAARLSNSHDFINEMLDDAASVINVTEKRDKNELWGKNNKKTELHYKNINYSFTI
ncbi:hypothetical protein TNCV_574921 [Trichonephila clavipes]|nr:hypothetical protein TNCV_574921 [Trichonephila clavipes]